MTDFSFAAEQAYSMALQRLYGITLVDAGIGLADVDQTMAPEEWASWYGTKHDLTPVEDWSLAKAYNTLNRERLA